MNKTFCWNVLESWKETLKHAEHPVKINGLEVYALKRII